MASRDNYTYFIITAQTMSYSWIRPGSICYINEKQYSTLKLQKKDTVPVTCVGSSVHFPLPTDILQPLTRQASQFLLAVDSFEERLKEFARLEALEQAMELSVGSEVTVEQNGEWLKGVVKYIGPLTEPSILGSSPIVGVFFGVELQVSNSLLSVYK